MSLPRLDAQRVESESESSVDGLAVLALISVFVGAIAGLIGAAFRLSLVQADAWRNVLITWAQQHAALGALLVIVVCSAATTMAAFMVQRLSPQATGSGIPQVEAVLDGRMAQPAWHVIWVRFIGGLLAIGSGLALGREGPTVHMGASIAHSLGRLLGRNDRDCRVLLAAGAGAGLATAFNAPIAGAVFVLEELARKFDTRITIATFGASLGAIAVSRFLLGQGPDFQVEPFPYAGLGQVWPYLGLGIIAGVLGAMYNISILKALQLADLLRRVAAPVRAAIIGATVGAIGFFLPNWIGGGDDLTQRVLTESPAITVLLAMFIVRFLLGALSYAALTPGGLFAPMLVLGAQSGQLYGRAMNTCLPASAPQPHAFAVVGMAAFFTAVVRAPLTGVILVIELTGSFTLFLPMLAACFAAMAVATLLRIAPIYDSLLERTLSPSNGPTRPRPESASR